MVPKRWKVVIFDPCQYFDRQLHKHTKRNGVLICRKVRFRHFGKIVTFSHRRIWREKIVKIDVFETHEKHVSSSYRYFPSYVLISDMCNLCTKCTQLNTVGFTVIMNFPWSSKRAKIMENRPHIDSMNVEINYLRLEIRRSKIRENTTSQYFYRVMRKLKYCNSGFYLPTF